MNSWPSAMNRSTAACTSGGTLVASMPARAVTYVGLGWTGLPKNPALGLTASTKVVGKSARSRSFLKRTRARRVS